MDINKLSKEEIANQIALTKKSLQVKISNLEKEVTQTVDETRHRIEHTFNDVKGALNFKDNLLKHPLTISSSILVLGYIVNKIKKPTANNQSTSFKEEQTISQNFIDGVKSQLKNESALIVGQLSMYVVSEIEKAISKKIPHTGVDRLFDILKQNLKSNTFKP